MNQHSSQQPAPFAPIPSLFIDPVPRFFLLVLLFLAFLFGAVELAGFCLAVLLLSSGAKLWRRAASAGVTYRFLSDRRRAFPGEVLTFTVRVTNASVLPVAVRSRLAGTGASAASEAVRDLRFCKVGSRSTVSTGWAWKAPGRGIYSLGPPVTEAGDALGFFFSRVDHDEPLEIVVYPRICPIPGFEGQSREIFGSLRSRGLIEDPVNLVGTREYQPGSPARAIHWKASARMNRLQEKVFEPSRRARYLLILDVCGFHETGDATGFEESLETAASMASHLDRAGASLGAMTNARIQGGHSPVVPVARRPGHLSSILDMLARMTMEEAENQHTGIQAILPQARGVTRILFTHSVERRKGNPGSVSAEGAVSSCVVVTRQDPGAAYQTPGSMEVVSIAQIRRGGRTFP